jgi:ABC-type multidrug transport system ATPase subunit
MSEIVIQTKGLDFNFSKSKKAIDNLSLNVPKGSIYGFLGPNGAGKSTTMRLLTGIIPDDSDAIEIFGESLQKQIPEIFNRLGCLVESPALYLHLSGYNNLKYIAQIRKVDASRIDEILKIVDLYNDRNRKVKQYSLGMKQRLAIAMALLSTPEILLLDEPVNGLDPNGMVEIRRLLVRINQQFGTTIFVSSHLLSEIEKMCTHVGIISKGKLRFEGTMKELSQQFGKCKVVISLKNPKEILEKIPSEYHAVEIESESKISLVLEDKEMIPNLTKHLIQSGAEIYEIKIQDGLEEWFMSLTQ